jgi:hypothetical protein
MRLIAVFRYTLAITLHSQRYLPPVGLFVLTMSLFVASVSTGPVVPVFAPMTVVLLVCSAWLTVAVVNVEDPVQRTITVVNAGRPATVLLAAVLVVLLGCLLLTAVVLGVPTLFGRHHVTPADLLVGVESQLTGSCLGVATGLVTSRLVIRRSGHALLVALALLLVFLLGKGIPPINPLVRLLASARPATELLAPAALDTGIAVVTVVAALIVTHTVAVRRD